MADKQIPLSIVLRTVDKATAGIQAVNRKLDAISKPTKDLSKAIGELGDKSGFNAVVSGFKGIGGAVSDLVGKVALVGGLAAAAVAGVFHLVDEFDDLGDKSEKLGVTNDFLAAMRYAAERAGSSVDTLDSGLTSFSENMGQLRANGGRMLKFLTSVSPALVTQLKATKGNEAAFRLLADAMAKVTDPQKRMALAMKTVGNSDLAPLLAKGSRGLLELQGSFIGLAGSQEDAAAGAGAVDDALKDLKASTTGVKAAIVTGLAPALEVLVKRLTDWFVDHRGDVTRWAADIGDKLPGAISKAITWVGSAIDKVTEFVDKIGGWETAAAAAAAVVAGPLIAAVVALGAALLATPFGWVLASLAGIAAGIAAITGESEKLKGLAEAKKKEAPVAWHGGVPFNAEQQANTDAMMRTGRASAMQPVLAAADANMERISKQMGLNWADLRQSERSPAEMDATMEQARANLDRAEAVDALRPQAAPQEISVKVDFANAPPGMRVKTDTSRSPAATIDHTVGYQMGGFGGS